MANTIDIKGDSVVLKQLLERTISGEFVDDIVTNIGTCSFLNCTNITSVSFPAAKQIDVNAFSGCSSLESVSFPLVTSSGTNAFRDCVMLFDVTFPSLLSVYDYMFSGCSRLTRARFSVANSIRSYAFQGCPWLTTVILENTAQVATLPNAYAFGGAPNAIIYVPDELVDSYKSATNWSALADRIKPISELPEE